MVKKSNKSKPTGSKKGSTAPLKLDLSFGPLPQDFPFTRLPFDSCVFPWPLADGSVEEAHSAFLFQRVPAKLRGRWMDELWRVLRPGAKATVLVPHWTSVRAVQDFAHEWPPLAEQSFLYFNRRWRVDNKLTEEAYQLRCDFNFTYGYRLDPETESRAEDVRGFWVKHYTNAILDLQVVLEKIDTPDD